MTTPHVRNVVTGLGGLFIVVARVYRQGQLVHTVAIVHGSQAVPNHMLTGCSRDAHTVTTPHVRNVVTGLIRRLKIVARVDLQGQLVHTVTVIHGLQAVPNHMLTR